MSDNMTVGNNSVVIRSLEGLLPGPVAIGAGAMVIGDGSIDDVLRRDLIELLEACKRKHQEFIPGRWSCGIYYYNRSCDCGADELNAKIDAMIGRLTR